MASSDLLGHCAEAGYFGCIFALRPFIRVYWQGHPRRLPLCTPAACCSLRPCKVDEAVVGVSYVYCSCPSVRKNQAPADAPYLARELHELAPARIRPTLRGAPSLLGRGSGERGANDDDVATTACASAPSGRGEQKHGRRWISSSVCSKGQRRLKEERGCQVQGQEEERSRAVPRDGGFGSRLWCRL